MTALIKSGTRDPLLHTPVMPVNVFAELFYSWPENDLLCIKQLRLKTIVLLSISLMLRPSDIAPKAVVFNAANMSSPRSKAIFSAKHVKFLEDGSASITLVGTKNDLQRSGFECHLPNHADSLVDPVGALRHYMSRTETTRNNIPQKPVFITLRPPFKHLEASGIAKVLEEGITLAGLGGKGFSAKSFRPTGATAAVDMDVEPDKVRRLGRWKTQEVFYYHYVQNKMPSNYTTNLLSVTKL